MLIEVFYVLGLIFVGFVFWVFIPHGFGAPYQATANSRVRIMLKLARVKKGDKAVDLGSGSGELVIALARKGAEAHGYEVNPFLVWYSRKMIKRAGLKGKAFIHKENFWDVNLKDFDIITIYQVNYVMPRLAEKLQKEVKKSARIISNTWQFRKWKPIKKIKNIYLYKKSGK